MVRTMHQTVHLRYFAGLRETLGVEGEEFKLPRTPITLNRLRELLLEQYPEIAPQLKSSAVAVNLELTSQPDSQINPGDEVAFMPPVGGG